MLRLALALATISVLLVPSTALPAQVTVAWDTTTDDTIAGYKLYIGPAGQALPAPIDVGNVASRAVPGLETGQAYRAAVSAYDIFGQEGELSAELFFTASDPPPDADGDGLPDALEMAGCTSPTDSDSDDDGLPDGVEDANRDGARTGTETDPCSADTDGDGLADAAEDANGNGLVDPGETDPLTPENPLLFADDFSDSGTRGDPSWKTVRGRWSGTRQRSYASSGRRVDLAVVAAPGGRDFRSGRIEARAGFSKSFAKMPNAEIVFHYQDPAHYRYLRLTPKGLVLGQIGQFSQEPGGVKARRSRRLIGRSWHRVRLDIENGNLLKVYLNNSETPVIAFAFAAEASGGVGVQTRRARSRFDDLAVWSELVLR